MLYVKGYHSGFVAALVLVLLCTLAPLWLATTPPWLGLTLKVEAENQRILIDKVYAASPLAQQIESGQHLEALRLPNGEIFELEIQDLVEEPDFIIEYAELNRFFARQSQITSALSQATVALRVEGRWYRIKAQHRPLYSLHTMFWFQLFIGLFSALTGLAVWRFQRQSVTTRLFALTGVGFMLITTTASVYSGRELALDGELIRLLAALNHLASMLFAPAFVALLWYYPKRLHRWPLPLYLIAVYLLVWVLDTLQWMPNTDWGIRIPMVVGLSLSMLFAALQWRLTRDLPLERTALKWFLFSIYMGGATFVSVIFIAMLLGFEPVIPQGYAFGIVVFMYVGVALGISRYRLFDLDRWWFSTWLWLMSGALVVLADLLMIYLLELRPTLALGLSLLLVGWLYFPLRQWLLRRLLPSSEIRLESLFPELIRLGLVAQDSEQALRIWRGLLQSLFQPLYLQQVNEAPKKPELRREGLELCFPVTGGSPALLLGYPMLGRRLFGRDDQHLAVNLWHLAQNVLSVRQAYEEGAEKERQRIYSDLHDDLGAKLLSLIYRAKNAREADLARAALQDLRDVVSRSSRDDLMVEDLLADWQEEIRQRLESAGIELHWEQSEVIPQHLTSANCSLHLGRILREAVSNTIKHAEADSVSIEIMVDRDKGLEIRYQDNGQGLRGASPGRGLLNMQHRTRELGGELQWHDSANGLVLDLQVALTRAPLDSGVEKPPSSD